MSKRKAEVVDLTGLEDEDEGVRARRLRARAAVAAAAPTSAASSEEDSSGESDSEAADRDAAASEEEDELVTSDSDAEVLVPASKKRKGAAAKAPSANKKAGARKAGASRGGKAAGASSLPVRAGAGGAAAPGRGRRLRKQSKSKLQLGEEEAGSDEDELDEMSAEEAAEKGAGSAFGVFDYSALALKPDHANRPLWVCPNGRVVLESFSPAYKAASDFLVAIAEPVCRPDAMHEYELTAHSLYAAVSVGLKTEEILAVLNRLSKTALPMEVCAFVRVSTQNYGKVKLVLQRNKFFLESAHPAVLRTLLADDVIAAARVAPEAAADGGAPLPDFDVADAPPELAAAELAAAARAGVDEAGGGGEGAGVPPAEDDDDRQLHSFEIDAAQVEHVKQRCLPSGLNYPTLEEYDFRADSVNPDCEGLELKAATVVRPYQEKSLTKMFGNGRARSGIIVLPCGAGKSLTGIAAASRIKKSVLCLCTSSVSVDQWRQQFKLWTQLPDASVVRFTSQMKESLPEGEAGVVVSTYSMIAFRGKRSEESEKILESIRGREWGLMLLDEVHVVPADMFRKVVAITKSHCKLGLTATLVREDERIEHLNFLIGPKLYEANWLDLQRGGFIANVQCAEVWCPMTKEFYKEYLDPAQSLRRQALYCMNPTKFRTCEYLIKYHEALGHKIIVFSDNIFALKDHRLKRPLIYGKTAHAERSRVLAMFKNLDKMPVLLLSKVGDNSIDIPEANVIIQISSHAGSRRQEAQRLGRILRPKSRQASLGPRPPNEYDAFFYSLVSTDTVEMYFSTKRQQFLVDQGYAFKVVPDLLDHVDVSGLQLASHADQTALLSKVLVVGAEDAGEEMLPADEDAIDTGVPLARRFERRAYDLSGAPRGLGYAEYTKSGGSAPLPRLGGGGSGSGALRRQQGPFAASERTHHSLLKDRYGGGKR